MTGSVRNVLDGTTVFAHNSRLYAVISTQLIRRPFACTHTAKA